MKITFNTIGLALFVACILLFGWIQNNQATWYKYLSLFAISVLSVYFMLKRGKK